MWDHSQKIRRANLNAGLVAAAWETQLQILIYELSECRKNYLFAFEEMFDLELDLIILSAKLEGVYLTLLLQLRWIWFTAELCLSAQTNLTF